MPLPRLLLTSSFRLTLLYVLLFSASVAVLAGVIYLEMTHYGTERQDDLLKDELRYLSEAAQGESRAQLVALITLRADHPYSPRMRYLLQDGDGKVLAGNLPAMTPRFGKFWFEAPKRGDPNKVRSVRGRSADLPGGLFLLVGQERKAQEELEELRRDISRVLGYGAAATLLLALVGGAVLSVGLLRRVEAVGVAARDIMEGDLSQRLPLRGVDDEFERLSLNLNRMLERIEAHVESMRQVSSDIAHDLRTPLTRLRQRLERAQRLDDAGRLREALGDSIGDVDAILGTFGALLRIAQIEADTRKSRHRRVDLSELLHTLIEVYQPMMEAKQQRLQTDIAADLWVLGDRDLLAQMLANLLENAGRHAPEGALIEVSARRGGARAEIVIADNGPGIPEPEYDKVFRRLYRLERSRTSPGSGLGLALVAAIAHMHEAQIVLGDNRPGLRVQVLLQAAPDASGA